MKNRMHVYVQALLCGMLMASTVIAADAPPAQKSEQNTKPSPPPAPTKEQREKMAKAHEKIAACLRTDQTISECHQQAMKACQDAGPGCMMYAEHMKHGMGHMDGQKHGQMQQGMPMNSGSSTPPADKK